jgi:hypothetical protein
VRLACRATRLASMGGAAWSSLVELWQREINAALTATCGPRSKAPAEPTTVRLVALPAFSQPPTEAKLTRILTRPHSLLHQLRLAESVSPRLRAPLRSSCALH